MKYIFLLFASAAMILCAGCSVSYSKLSVSFISSEWLGIKNEIKNLDVENSLGILVRLDNFDVTMQDFLASPIGEMYKLHTPEKIRYLENTHSAINQLKNAIKNKDNAEIFSAILEVDGVIETLRYIDTNLSNISLLHIFLLFLFFSLLIVIVILFMRKLYTKFERAEIREQQSMIFSREIVMAQEHERKRIAREFHDTVAQDLWRLSFQVDNEQIAEEQRAIIQRIRTICDTLIPPDFQRRGLLNALKKLIFDFEQRTNIECRITIQEGLSLEVMNSDTQLQCFRIVQECLTNIEKHAEATEVLVFVRKDEDILSIYISDNGRGFSPPDRDSCLKLRTEGHFGLWGIYERTASISGTLMIGSEKDEGTMVTLQVPIKIGVEQ